LRLLLPSACGQSVRSCIASSSFPASLHTPESFDSLSRFGFVFRGQVNLAIGQRRFHARYGPEIQAEPDRRRAIEKVFELVPQVDGTRYDVSRRVLRVVVHENPFATIRFPPTLFRGPYDERYGVRRADGSVQRMFCGRALRQLEREEHESGVSPLHARRFTKRPARSRSNPSSSGKTSG
jgi:hypothetical protein